MARIGLASSPRSSTSHLSRDIISIRWPPGTSQNVFSLPSHAHSGPYPLSAWLASTAVGVIVVGAGGGCGFRPNRAPEEARTSASIAMILCVPRRPAGGMNACSKAERHFQVFCRIPDTWAPFSPFARMPEIGQRHFRGGLGYLIPGFPIIISAWGHARASAASVGFG